jgi:hypothetical protein
LTLSGCGVRSSEHGRKHAELRDSRSPANFIHRILLAILKLNDVGFLDLIRTEIERRWLIDSVIFLATSSCGILTQR